MSKLLSAEQTQALLDILKARFEKNKHRHEKYHWQDVETKLLKHPQAIWSLFEMERTGGEPDLVDLEMYGDAYSFVDCASESPTGRRSTCYDQEAQESRKKFPPEHSAVGLANQMGIELLTEAEYRKLQTFEPFDIKTSSWILTPTTIRKLNGALFCDYRYGVVFTYHNGADSYYASRGFRGKLKI